MKNLDRIIQIYNNEENDFLKINNTEKYKVTALYSFYHYYNADETQLDNLNNSFCLNKNSNIVSFNQNKYDENSIDILVYLPENIISEIDNVSSFSNLLKNINEEVANIICHNINDNDDLISKLEEFFTNEETNYIVKILCYLDVDIDYKITLQNIAGSYFVKNNKIRFEVYFKDDILEEVQSVEEPEDIVSKGIVKLYNKNVLFFGEEKSFLCFVSAQSLKDIFYKYSTKGLFDSNLRYYVKSQKIDGQITETIKNEPSNFCYYNNGIIITCNNYELKDNSIILDDFSIVNGGQTTNLIGRVSLSEDFPVMCKVIKNKYEDLEEKITFLAKVAEASNTQKPIKAKDLIANRPEQRMLKNQFERAGIFLQLKRGDKINKEKYKYTWQNATNDNIAQMLYSSIYQMPGFSKNSKSKILDTTKIYDKIFKNSYSDSFFVSLQFIKVTFNNWVKKQKKIEKIGSNKLGLAKNTDLYIVAAIVLIYKFLLSKELFELISVLSLEELNYKNEYLKNLLSQNDVGQLNLLSNDAKTEKNNEILNEMYEFVFENIFIPSYLNFRKKYPTYSYGNFVKSDMYYYNYVLAEIINKFTIIEKKVSKLNVYDLSVGSTVDLNEKAFEDYKPGLETELIEYRKKVFHESNGLIQAYEVFKNMQLVKLIKYRPKTLEELKKKIEFSDLQCKRFGKDICRIINKYSDITDYIEG